MKCETENLDPRHVTEHVTKMTSSGNSRWKLTMRDDGIMFTVNFIRLRDTSANSSYCHIQQRSVQKYIVYRYCTYM
jgi:hypothetical protein